MKTIAFVLLTLSQMAFADTYNYQLYYEPEFTDKLDIKVQVVLSGKFNKSSTVKEVLVWGEEKKKPVLLFRVPADQIKATWKAGNTLSLYTIKPLKPMVKKQYIPIHSDTFIPANNKFGMDFTIKESGTDSKNPVEFNVDNQTQEEMALFGYLKKI